MFSSIKHFLLRKLANALIPFYRDKYTNIVFKGGVTPKKNNIDLGVDCEFTNTHSIDIGKNVKLGNRSSLHALDSYSTIDGMQEFKSKIVIGDNVRVTSELQIYALESIIIENDVLIAKNVFMCDGLHGYSNVKLPYMHQPLFKIRPIKIEKGAWIGQNVVIMPGVTIGEFSIIGANSVVTKSIHEYSIAVGSPAKEIKRWNHMTSQWIVVE